MDIDLQKYRELFFQESKEYLDMFFSHLSRISGEGLEDSVLNEFFRAAHSIKGMAASVEYDDVAKLAHAIEDLFDRIKRRESSKSVEVGRIFRFLKGLEALIEYHQGLRSDRVDLEGLLKEINQEVDALGGTERKEIITAPEVSKAPTHFGDAKFNIRVEIDPESESPAVRAYMVIRKAKEFGEVVSTTPEIAELKRGKFSGKLDMFITTNTKPEKIIEELKKLSGVKSLSISETEDKQRPTAQKSKTIKVKEELLDEMLSLTGELIVAKSGLAKSVKDLLSPEGEGFLETMSNLITQLKERILSVRLLPMSFLTDRFPRVVLESAQKTGKEVELIVNGEDVEIDRLILDALHDPMTHILRNAVDHGIEPPDERESRGKKRTGRIEITARRIGEYVEIAIKDDGRGMDADALRKKAIEKGMISKEEGEKMSYEEALYLACLPGLSTSNELTSTSGRGVGLDVVKNVVENYGGVLKIASVPKKGTEILIKLPLNISILKVLILRTGNEVFGIPLGRVERILEIDSERFEDELFEIEGRVVRVIPSASFYENNNSDPRAGVLVRTGRGEFIIGVDEVLTFEELYVLPVPKPISKIGGISGVSITGNGNPIFILDPYYIKGEE